MPRGSVGSTMYRCSHRLTVGRDTPQTRAMSLGAILPPSPRASWRNSASAPFERARASILLG